MPSYNQLHKGKSNIYIYLFLLAFYYLLSQFNIILKYGGNYWDGDALVMKYYTAQVLESGSILVNQGYGSGVNYQIFATILCEVCKFDLIQLYSYIIPILNVSLIFLVYIIMNQLTGDKKVAILATFIILLQPDFLLMTHRAKHDPYSLVLGLLLFTYIIKYLNTNGDSKKYAFFILSIIFLTSISLFSLPFFSLYTFGIIIYAILDAVFSRNRKTYSKSLLYFILVSVILILYLNSLVYPPYDSFYNYLGGMIESILSIFNDPFAESGAIYNSYVEDAYDSIFKFIILFTFNLIIGIVSIYSLLKNRKMISLETKLIYISFLILTGLMFISDRYGFASNMGLRTFYYWTFPAVAISSIWLSTYINSKKFNTKKILILICIISLLFWASHTKTTADSSYINIPYNYLDAEVSVLKFAEDCNASYIFADHRLKYLGAGYMSTNFWRRNKFNTNISSYSHSDENGLYINSILYHQRGYRGDTEFMKIDNNITLNLNKNKKIYENGFTEAYLHK